MNINTPDKIVATVFTSVCLFCWFFMAPLATVLQPLALFALFCLTTNRVRRKGIVKKSQAVLLYGVLSSIGYSAFLMGGVHWSIFLVGNTLFLWFTVRLLAYGYYYATLLPTD